MNRFVYGILVCSILAFIYHPVESSTDEPADLGLSQIQQIMELAMVDEFDSALVLLNDFKFSTIATDADIRLELLLHIAAGTFSEELYNYKIIDNLIRLRKRCLGDYPFYRHRPLSPDEERLSDFVSLFARQIGHKTKENSLERLITNCLGECCDNLFAALEEERYENTKLKRYRQIALSRTLDFVGGSVDPYFWNWAFYSGYWNPTGQNKALDNHPIIGALGGVAFSRVSFGLVGELRVLRARNPYIIQKDFGEDTTKSFLGSYFGLEASHELYRSAIQRVDVRLGFGYDGFSYQEKDADRIRTSVSTYTLNFGVGYMYFPRRSTGIHIGAQLMYSILSYDREIGSGLSGNAISLRVLFGRFGNSAYYSRLSDLGYVL